MGLTVAKGNIAETAVLADLLRLGYRALIPWGGNARYDLAVDVDGQLIRIQCKSTWTVLDDTAVRFKARGNSGWRGNRQRGYLGDADHFGVYVPERALVLYVPVAEVPVSEITLFYERPPGRYGKRARLVDTYRKPQF